MEGECDRFCYNQQCFDSPEEAFELFTNTEDEAGAFSYEFLSWHTTTDDLRQNCGGKYVYAYTIKYKKR